MTRSLIRLDDDVITELDDEHTNRYNLLILF